MEASEALKIDADNPYGGHIYLRKGTSLVLVLETCHCAYVGMH